MMIGLVQPGTSRGMFERDVAETDIAATLAPFDLARELSSSRTQGLPNMIALVRETALRLA